VENKYENNDGDAAAIVETDIAAPLTQCADRLFDRRES
jgi:hypothetical protein